MKGRIERLHLLQQSIDQFLRPADGQRRNVVDRLVRIEFGALTGREAQGIDDMRADAEKAQFEDLKQPYGARADDDRFDVLFRHLKPDSLLVSIIRAAD